MSQGNLGALGGSCSWHRDTFGNSKKFLAGATPAWDSQPWFLSSTVLTGTQQPGGDRNCSRGHWGQELFQRPQRLLREQHLVTSWCSPHPPVNGLCPHPELGHTIICDSCSQAWK